MVSYQDKHYINTSMYDLIFGDFAPALLDVSLDDILQFLWDKPSSKKNVEKSTFTLVPCSILMIPCLY